MRPFNAAPAAAPKSPVSYPPQQQPQQQWGAPKPAAGGNAYATLPRSNVGQQGKEEDDYDDYLSGGEWV